MASIDTGIVARLLPSVLEPAPQTMSASGKHPVYFLLGRQSDVSGTLPVFSSFGVTYHEAIVLVPFTRFRGHRREFIFMPKLYLDSLAPTLLGQCPFGFAKGLADATASAGSYEVQDFSGRKLLKSSFQLVERYSRPAIDAGYLKLASVFSQPFVGFRRTLLGPLPIASTMTFDNYERVPVKLQLTLGDDELLRTGLAPAYSFSALDAGVVDTAVHLISDWTLSYPTPFFQR